MRISIIPSDGYVGVGVNDKDKYGLLGLDMTGVDPKIHAIQWYDTWGEIEWIDNKDSNTRIDDLSPYQFLIDRWQAAKDNM
jgi:hypothetical protein